MISQTEFIAGIFEAAKARDRVAINQALERKFDDWEKANDYGSDAHYDTLNSGFTGGQAARVVNRSPYGGALRLWAERTQNLERQRPANRELAMMAKLLKPTILDRYRHDFPDVIVESWPERVVIHSDLMPWELSVPDAIICDRERGFGLLKAKTASEKAIEYAALSDAQNIAMQHDLMVTGCAYGHVAVLYGGWHLKVFVVERDETTQKWLGDAEERLHRRIQERVELTADEMEGDLGAIVHDYAELHDQDDGEIQIAKPWQAELIRQWREVSDQVAPLEKRKKELSELIKLQIGESLALQMPDGTGMAEWKSEARDGYTVDPKTIRVLRWKKAKVS